jgi:hypothetical protein
MKKWVALLLGLIFLISTKSFAQSYPYITELRGLEDSLSNTHLFYRYVHPFASCWSKSIYHIDIINNIDTFFIWDLGGQDPIYGDCEGDYVFDYEFFNNDPAKFIYCGYNLWIDPIPIINRYDGEVPVYGIGGVTNIELSKQHNNLVVGNLAYALLKSIDGGYNFIQLDSVQAVDNLLISLSKNNDSQLYGINDNKLIRSQDEGSSYIIVDNSEWNDNSHLFYDQDGSHIYGLSISYNFSTQSYSSKIYISDDNGNPFTWNNIIGYQGKSWFTIDEDLSGEIYYSAGKRIFKSLDFGSTFSQYKELDRIITGLYKKSGTNILFASTPLKIYEITPDTTLIIKSLPIPQEVLNLYPLAIGNKWVYNTYGWWTDTTYHSYNGITYREVVGDTVMGNGQFYYKLFDPTTFNYPWYLFERIDSSSGKVYRYDNSLGLPNDEYLIDDLLAEVGDTIWSSRHQYQDYFPFICTGEGIFNKWGIQGPRKIFTIYDLTGYTYSLSQGVGIDSIYDTFDFGENFVTLKGCVLDGVVYGDTITVGVQDEEKPIVTNFKLEQNYPNPFNPSTKIQYAISSRQFVTLKVYDILGNEIATLVSEEKPAGEYEVTFDSHSGEVRNLPSGVYFYQLKAGTFIQTKKMVYLK